MIWGNSDKKRFSGTVSEFFTKPQDFEIRVKALLLNHAIVNEIDSNRSLKRCLQGHNLRPLLPSSFLSFFFFLVAPVIERG